MNKVRLSTAFVALAALFWGLSGGIAGILINNGWDPYVVSLYRGTIGLLFVLIWLVLRPRGNGLAQPVLWFWSVVAGLGVAGNFAFYFVSISESSVAVAATLMYCAPVFVYIISFGLGLEESTPFKWLAITLVMLGIVLLTRIYDIGVDAITPLGIGAGLLSGLSYAVFIFGFKYAAPHGSPQAILTIAFATLVTVLLLPSNLPQTITALQSPSWPLFAALGVLGAGLSFIIYIIGLNHTAPAVASIVAMVEPVTASLFGVWVLGESVVGLQLVGMGLILVTVTALSVYSDSASARIASG
jgi:drug/metabolite transporter (DMT)-like permease